MNVTLLSSPSDNVSVNISLPVSGVNNIWDNCREIGPNANSIFKNSSTCNRNMLKCTAQYRLSALPDGEYISKRILKRAIFTTTHNDFITLLFIEKVLVSRLKKAIVCMTGYSLSTWHQKCQCMGCKVKSSFSKAYN